MRKRPLPANGCDNCRDLELYCDEQEDAMKDAEAREDELFARVARFRKLLGAPGYPTGEGAQRILDNVIGVTRDATD